MDTTFDAQREPDDYFADRGRFVGASARYVGMAAGGQVDELVAFYAEQPPAGRLPTWPPG